jgi:hypothetical protein
MKDGRRYDRNTQNLRLEGGRVFQRYRYWVDAGILEAKCVLAACHQAHPNKAIHFRDILQHLTSAICWISLVERNGLHFKFRSS